MGNGDDNDDDVRMTNWGFLCVKYAEAETAPKAMNDVQIGRILGP